MRVKTTAMLCEASFVTGAILTPPILRRAKREAGVMARRGARGYVKAREQARKFGEATGRPGQMTTFAAAFAAQAAKDTVDTWWKLVDEAERQAKFEQAIEVEPPTTIRDYVGEDYVSSPS